MKSYGILNHKLCSSSKKTSPITLGTSSNYVLIERILHGALTCAVMIVCNFNQKIKLLDHCGCKLPPFACALSSPHTSFS